MQTLAERGVRSVGLPAASEEPNYLHSMARAFDVRLDDERILLVTDRASS
jgi:hypothetical protein